MILQDKAKEDFRKWVKENDYPVSLWALEDGLIDKTVEYALIIEWLDSVGIYITIESYLGGGGVVFYPQIEYRNENHVDVFDCPKWDDGVQWYSTSRQEATKAAIEKANEIYNQSHNEI